MTWTDKLPKDHPASSGVGEQLDELVAHLIENVNRLSADASRARARIEKIETRMHSVFLGCIVGLLGGLLLFGGQFLWQNL